MPSVRTLVCPRSRRVSVVSFPLHFYLFYIYIHDPFWLLLCVNCETGAEGPVFAGGCLMASAAFVKGSYATV